MPGRCGDQVTPVIETRDGSKSRVDRAHLEVSKINFGSQQVREREKKGERERQWEINYITVQIDDRQPNQYWGIGDVFDIVIFYIYKKLLEFRATKSLCLLSNIDFLRIWFSERKG